MLGRLFGWLANIWRSSDWKFGVIVILWIITLSAYAAAINYGFKLTMFTVEWFVNLGIKNFEFNPKIEFYSLIILQLFMLVRLLWKRSVAVVEENRIWVVELFGAYYDSWEKGLHLIYPFGGIVKVVNIVPKEDKTISIVFTKSDKETISDSGTGVVYQATKQVEFKDSSAPLSVDFIISIKNAYDATYKIDDLYFMLSKLVESSLRSFFANINIDRANQIKSDYLVNVIFAEKPIDHDNLDQYIGDLDYQQSQVWLKMVGWGVEIIRIVISDIDLSKKIIEAREAVLFAKKKAEAALEEAKAKVTMAEANKKSLVLEGQGRKSQIADLIGSGLSAEQAYAHMSNMEKWKAIASKKDGSSLIIDSVGNDGMAGMGAKFGAGAQAQKGNQGNTGNPPNSGNNP